MCPACVASAALMVAGVMSTGGLTALAAKLLHSKIRLPRSVKFVPTTQSRGDEDAT
jgi:hypothetical protein